MNRENETIYVVLVHPEESGNIGSACRAMKTMGITRLRVVDPVEYDEERIRYMAVHAADVWDGVEFFDTLDPALADCAFSAGISRRRGKRRKYFAMSPENLADRIAQLGQGPVALVFGNEQHGLTHEELAACDVAVRIPSSPEFPSLNLSHAVQIIAYALFRQRVESRAYSPIDRTAQDELSVSICESLRQIGFFTFAESDETERFLREIVARAGLTRKESVRLDNLFKKIRSLTENYRGGDASGDGNDEDDFPPQR